MVTLLGNRLIIDLTDDSKAIRAIRRWARRLALLLVMAALVTLLMRGGPCSNTQKMKSVAGGSTPSCLSLDAT